MQNNACKFINSYGLKWYEAHRLKETIFCTKVPTPDPYNGVIENNQKIIGINENYRSVAKFFFKILDKNLDFAKKSKFWTKIKSLNKNLYLAQKLKVRSKLFWTRIEIFHKNRSLWQKSTIGSYRPFYSWILSIFSLVYNLYLWPLPCISKISY